MISKKQEIFLKGILGDMNDYVSFYISESHLTIDGCIPSFYQLLFDKIKIIRLNVPSLKIEIKDKDLVKFLKKK